MENTIFDWCESYIKNNESRCNAEKYQLFKGWLDIFEKCWENTHE